MNNMDQSALSEYKDLYFETAHENLKTIADNLAVLRADPHNTRALELFFTTAHSLKGKSKLMGYVPVADAARLLERTGRALQAGSPLTQTLSSALLETTSSLQACVTKLQTAGEPTDMAQVIARLEHESGQKAQETL